MGALRRLTFSARAGTVAARQGGCQGARRAEGTAGSDASARGLIPCPQAWLEKALPSRIR